MSRLKVDRNCPGEGTSKVRTVAPTTAMMMLLSTMNFWSFSISSRVRPIEEPKEAESLFAILLPDQRRLVSRQFLKKTGVPTIFKTDAVK